jgi:phosphatidylglycerol lysyltransferase
MESGKINSIAIASKARTQVEGTGVRFVSILIWLWGTVYLLSAIQPALVDRLAVIGFVIPSEIQASTRVTTAFTALALFVLAGSLWRRKKVGWILTMILLLVSLGKQLVEGFGFNSGITIVLIFLLLLLCRRFNRLSNPSSIHWGLTALATALIILLVFGTAGYIYEGILSHHPISLPAAASQTVSRMALFHAPNITAGSAFSHFLALSIYVVMIAMPGFALLMLMRPVIVRHPGTTEERQRAAVIVKKYGRSATARPALFDDKSYFFSQGGSVIAYAARGRGAMALGDPIGPAEDIPLAIMAFKEYCDKNDWEAAFISALPENLVSYREAGFKTLHIGDDAIVSLATYDLQSSRYKDIRNSITKLSRLGYKAKIHGPPLEDRLYCELKKISDVWLASKHSGEKHYSIGWFNDDYIRNESVFVVYAPDMSPTAFANLKPEYQKNEVTIDLMRHYQKVEPGTMDFLFGSLLEWAKESGYESVCLGQCPFVKVGENPDDPLIERFIHTFSDLLPSYNIKGLHHFKNKFYPHWEPRYLVYPAIASLPNTLFTLLRVII